MGLDMYAYAVDKQGQREDLHYWRKHPNLHGWMERKWESRGCPVPANGDPQQLDTLFTKDRPIFNCIPLELKAGDLDELEQDVLGFSLPETDGFFFGKSDQTDYDRDLDFLLKARQALAEGKQVFYDSWW